MADLFDVIAGRLESVSAVLSAEHKWLGSIVDWSRKIDDSDEDLAEQIKSGWLSEDDAKERRAIDELHLPKVNVDMHQKNIHSAVHILEDAAKTLRALFENDDSKNAA